MRPARVHRTHRSFAYIVDDNAHVMGLASALQVRGFDIRGKRPPPVPAGTVWLRLFPTLNVREDDVSDMPDALVEETWMTF